MKKQFARNPKPTMRIILPLLAALGIMFLSAGCVGVYKNTDVFAIQPHEGMSEVEMLQSFGAPHFSAYVEDQKIYTYKVRDNKYIIAVGVYDGYDMVVTCQNGTVKKVGRVERPRSFSVLFPTPWAETE